MLDKTKPEIDREYDDRILAFLFKTTYQDKTDRELKLLIKVARQMILERQQKRARVKLERKAKT